MMAGVAVATLGWGASWSVSPKDIIEKVQARYDKMTDAVIQFRQNVRFRVSKSEQTVSGTLIFKKKNKYRIETDQRVVVTNGVTSWSWNPSTKQVVIDKYKEQSHGISPEQLLLRYPNDYYSTLVGEEKLDGESCYVLKLSPKQDNTFITGMKTWITSKWLIRRVEVVDMNGATTTYHITSIQLDQEVPDSRFEFKPPQGASVIDLR